MTRTISPSDTLLELAERCEAATGPDEILDGAICAALCIGFDAALLADGVTITYEADEDEGSVTAFVNGNKFKRYRAPIYTASVDAALTLVPEGWWLQYLGQRIACWATRVETNGPPPQSIGLCHAATPALAICAAALRARAAQ